MKNFTKRLLWRILYGLPLEFVSDLNEVSLAVLHVKGWVIFQDELTDEDSN